jgi:hypothetical protein
MLLFFFPDVSNNVKECLAQENGGVSVICKSFIFECVLYPIHGNFDEEATAPLFIDI